MKKAALLFLLCIFLFNTVGYFFAFKTVQYEIKQNVKSEIKSKLTIDELIAITINKTDITSIEWNESGKEIFYNDELYDIVKSTETATTITYYCLNDRKEKSLFADLDEHINTHIAANKPLENSGSKKIVDHVIKLYFFNESSTTFETSSFSLMFSPIFIHYTPVFIETNSPPPEFV